MKDKQTKNQSKSADKDYEKLGRLLANVFESGYLDKKKLIKFSFLRGIFMGLGSVIGATVVVALVVWLLSLFDGLRWVGPLLNDLQQTIQR